MRSVLVLRGGALGDFIVSLPALGQLRARWPKARIELVGNRTAGELGMADGLLDAVHSQHEAVWSRLYAAQPLPGELERRLAEFDCVVSWWPDPEGELASHFPVRPGQGFVAGSAKPSVSPAARHYCATLDGLGLKTDDWIPRLQFPRISVREPGRVIIHPGSSSPGKNWPLVCWIELCRRLRGEGLLIDVVCGELEAEVVASFVAEAPVQAGLPLCELARRLGRAGCYAGHDTGVTHLAAASGCPVVALFGPTDPERWAPSGDRVTALRRGTSVDAIPVGEVADAVLAQLRDRA